MLWGCPIGWVYALGVSAPRRWGSAWSQGGVCSRGVSGLGGVPGPGGVVSQHALRQTPLWTEFLTHATENITLPQTSFAGGKNLFEIHLPELLLT